MADLTIYNSEIDWKTKAVNVVQLTRANEDNPATYRLTVKSLDTNDKGAWQKEVDYLFVDNFGSVYPIIAVNGDEIDVVDIFRTRKCPKAGKVGRICRSVADGNGEILAPIKYEGLNKQAESNARRKEIDVLFKKLYNERYLLDPTEWKKNLIDLAVKFGVTVGLDNKIYGNESMAIGVGGTTRSFRETFLGSYGLDTTALSDTDWNVLDLLFSIGNGTDNDNRSNAVEIYKSGLVKLHNALLIGDYDHGDVDPINGMIRFTEANGFEYWKDTEWVGFGGNSSFPATITSTTTNEDNGITHTHQLGNIVIENIVKLDPNQIKFGALYNWYSAVDERGISSDPDWRVPLYAEFDLLNTYLGGFENSAGGKLKETGFTYWNTPNTDATNEVGFNGRGAGRRDIVPSYFTWLKYGLFMYTSDAQEPGVVNTFVIYNDGEYIGTTNSFSEDDKKIGCSIRLIYSGSGTPTTYTGNDGKVYPVVLIGTQYWISCNLNETKYRNGDYIHGFDDGVYTPISNTDWASLTTEAMCYYNDDETNGGGKVALSSMLISDHGQLTGLENDDHTQYHNDTRGDARYLQKSNNLSDLASQSTSRDNLGLGSIATKNFWTGTLAAYNAITTKDANTIYHIEE